jgi:Uma2 family endonuclease
MNMPVALPAPAVPTRPPHDEPLYEVVNGQRVELPPMSIYASWIATRISRRLEAFADSAGLGTVVTEALFILDRARDFRRRPDVALVVTGKWPVDRPLPKSGDWEMIPDLAIEVISPNDGFEDVIAKMVEYFRTGVQQVWLVVPASCQIYVYDSPTQVRILTAADEWDGGRLLPGLRLPVGELFQRQPQGAPHNP